MANKKKVFGLLLGFIFLFVAFLFLLMRPSDETKAINEISNSASVEDVKAIWYKYKNEIFGNNSSQSDILNSDFIKVVNSKLEEFQLSQSEINKVKDWLPSQINLNVIIVPDLSARIIDAVNNPNQITNDSSLMATIWNSFETATKLKMNSKDRLLVDVSDPNQTQGLFRNIANELVFDLSNHKNKSNRLYFPGKMEFFNSKISQLYGQAVIQTTGADYRYYFGSVLPSRIKKNTVTDNYRNILIILTDGYLEISKNGLGIPITPNSDQLFKYCNGEVVPIVLPKETLDKTFPNLEVYLFEVNERIKGQGCHAVGLKNWWKEWFKRIEIKNIGEDNWFNQRQDAIIHAQSKIQEIFK